MLDARPLVPTPRELALGLEDPPDDKPVVDAPPSADAPGDRREAILAWTRGLDPRTVEGPKLPLLAFAMLALVTTWDDIALAVLLPEIRSEFALNVEFLARIGSVFFVASIVFGPAMGYLADRVRRVWMVRIGSILGNASSILSAVAPGVPFLVAARSLGGFSKAVAEPASFPLITDYYPPHSRGRVFFVIFAAGAAGGVLGPTVSGALGDRFGWRFAIGSLGVLATVVSLLTFVLREPPRGAMDTVEQRDLPGATARELPVSWAEGWRAGKGIATLRRIWYATPFLYAGGLGVNLLLSLYFSDVFQLGANERGYVAALGGLAALVGLVVAGPWADRQLAHDPGRLMGFLGLLIAGQAAAFVMLAFSPSLTLSIVISLPMLLVGGLITPTLITLMSVIVPARFRGLGLQTAAPWQLLGVLLFPNIVALADGWGVRGSVFAFAPVMLVGALILGTASAGVGRDMAAAKAAAVAEAAATTDDGGRRVVLVCRAVEAHYGGVQVLFGVDFDVAEGEVVALVGTNGAGKSTFLQTVAGLHPASGGAIFFDGSDITRVPAHEIAARGAVLMPGGRAVFPALTVEENLRMATWLLQSDSSDADARVRQALDYFPALKGLLSRTVGNLSGGERQMVGLAQALIMRPRLLLVDELSLGLAPSVVQRLLDVLRRIADEGTTIVLVEQSLKVAATIADRAVFLEKGEVAFSGPIGELLEQGDLARAVFMGGAGAAPRPVVRPESTPQRRRGASWLSVENVAVAFGGVHALRGVDVDVAEGEIVGIIGANGAGKTTLFDAISGFVTPDSGRIVLGGNEATDAPAELRARLGLGRSFQNSLLFPSLTVREAVAVALERQAVKNVALAAAWAPTVRRSEERLFRRVDMLIELFGLGDYAGDFLGELSTGTRRAVDIACAMAAEPRVLLLDEPSSGLAQPDAEALVPTLRRLVRQTGCGVLVIEHDLGLVMSLSDRLVAMELGGVLCSGRPADVVNDERVLASYLAASDAVVSRSRGVGEVLAGVNNGKAR